MTQDQFEQLVNAALDELPDEVINVLDNVAICVEDDSDDGDKLGEYVGVSRIERLGDDTGLLPDKIVLYRQAICDECDGDEATIAKEIRRTLWHEIAHHLGWDDDVLETVENQKGWR